MDNGGLFAEQILNGIKQEEITQPAAEREKLSFHLAARYGNTAIIQKYIQKYRGKKRKINKLNKQELSALHYAVRYGHIDVIQLLLQAKANINVVGADGAQPIHFAAKYFKAEKRSIDAAHLIQVVQPVIEAEENFVNVQNDGTVLKTIVNASIGNDTTDVITYLLRNGAHVNAIDNYRQTPLHYAAIKGNVEGMAMLVNWPGIDLEIIDTSGGTALHNACGNGKTEAAKLLLMCGATLMTWDNEHLNPLHYAATGGGVAILKQIISDIEKKKGAEAEFSLKDLINDQDNQGESILHLAVDTGHYDTCCYVIEKGANVNLCKNGYITPLHLAAATGDVNIVKLLVASGADIESQNVMRETPLHKAAFYNRVDVAKFLLEKGCSVDACNHDNETPLIVAAASGNLETIQVLLKHNADLHFVDTTDKSAIFRAAEENSIAVLKFLLEHIKNTNASKGDLVNQMDRFENTPLHIAAKKGFKHVVGLLLDMNADVTAWNDEQLTPLHLASMNENNKVALVLLNKNPSIINDTDESGNTALHLAALHGRSKVVDILIDFGASVDARNSVLWTPLDCAAAKGHTAVVLRLLDRDSPIDPMDLASTTPLHLASREGHYEVVEILLERGADLTLLDHTGRNALDMAVERSYSKTALVILDRPEWLSVMKNRSREGRNVTTPMRQLIKKLPDVAYTVLNKCMKLSKSVPLDSYDYKVQFYYDLLDDTYADWSNDADEPDEDQRSVVTSSSINFEEDNVNRFTHEVKNMMEKKENHPVFMMCRYKRGKLLNHPLVLSLIYEKWQRFGRVVFYSKFALYFVFLFFLTGYVLVSRPYLPTHVTINGTKQCLSKATNDDKNDALVIAFMIIGRFVVIVLGSLQLFLEILQLIARRMQYLSDFTNLMEWSIFILAIFYTLDDIDHYITSTHSCSTVHISIGSIAIFLAWIDLLLFIQKFPTLGIYVVMFTDVLKTFLKFSFTFVLFVIAFALGFFTLLGDQMLTFSTFARGVVKTTVMMIGEFDFDATFNTEEYDPPLITWFLFFIFVIIMTILLMNLMVGLAVDDIKGVLDQAIVTRVAMQVHLVLDVEKSLPERFRQRYIMKEKTMYPNRHSHWFNIMSHITTIDEIHKAVNPTKTVSDIVQEHTQSIRESVNKLKINFKEMSKQVRNIEQMMETLLKHSNISNDTDD